MRPPERLGIEGVVGRAARVDSADIAVQVPDSMPARGTVAREKRRCVVTTGSNLFNEGLDVVVEGNAVRTEDERTLQRLADLFAGKYDGVFGFTVQDGAFTHDEGGVAYVFEVSPVKAFSYERGEQGSATRYRF